MLMRTAAAYPLDQSAMSGTWSRPASPPVDVARTAEAFVVTVDLPGISPDAIDIEATSTTLIVRAERRPTQAGPDERLCLSERQLGVFARRVVLDAPVDVERVSACHESGVLTIRMPLVTRPVRRRITITTPATVSNAPMSNVTVATGARPEDGAQ
jgi:HSP20 family protein